MGASVVRVAAIGDLHIVGQAPAHAVRQLHGLHQRADLLVVAGDMTNHGTILQAELAAELFLMAKVPIFAVFGNHDRRTTRRRAFCRTLAKGGVTVLDGDAATIEVGRTSVGIAGVAGSGGGFWPIAGPDTLSRKAWQAFAVRARREAARLDAALSTLNTDLTIVVTHFSPTVSTLGEEPLQKYPLLGNSELARVIDQHDVDLVVHGHAHLGNPNGQTPNGIPVLNVAHDVTGGLVIYELPSATPAPIFQKWVAFEEPA